MCSSEGKLLGFDLISRFECATCGASISTIMQRDISLYLVRVRVISLRMAMSHISHVYFLNTHSSLVWKFEFQILSNIKCLSLSD